MNFSDFTEWVEKVNKDIPSAVIKIKSDKDSIGFRIEIKVPGVHIFVDERMDLQAAKNSPASLHAMLDLLHTRSAAYADPKRALSFRPTVIKTPISVPGFWVVFDDEPDEDPHEGFYIDAERAKTFHKEPGFSKHHLEPVFRTPPTAP